MAKTIEEAVYVLFEDMDFNALIFWANQLKIAHDEEEWFDDEWIDKESALKQEVSDAMIKVFEKGNNEPRQSKGSVSKRPSLRVHGKLTCESDRVVEHDPE